MTQSILHIDYETRSRAHLFKGGAYRYAQDPSTEIICMAYAFGDGAVQLWKPVDPLPDDVRHFMEQGLERSLHAHNAQFERLITNHVLGIETPVEAWYCTAAQARARALPGGLDDLGRCLGLDIQKDSKGKALIQALSVPYIDKQGNSTFRDDPALLQEMYDYNIKDVEAERAAEHASQPLTDDEFKVYLANERVNDAGLKVDLDFAKAAANYAEQEIAEISQDLKRLTHGIITGPRQFARLKKFVEPIAENDPLVRDAITRTVVDRRTGTKTTKTTLDRDARTKLLDLERQEPGRIGGDFIAIVELLDAAGRSSVSKFQAMANRADQDGRVRGAYMFSGAGQTGRFSSLGLQVHNFPRSTVKHFDAVRERVIDGQPIEDVMTVLSSMLRGAIVAQDGHTFVCGDWSGIESRVLPWLSDDLDANAVLSVFKDMDRDPSRPDNYMLAASDIYNVPAETVTKDQRAVGKVVVLACGYAGGVGAFNSMARAYQVVLTDDQASSVITQWRKANGWATRFWEALNTAAVDACHNPGTAMDAGRITFYVPPESKLLLMRLPSSRVLCYPQAVCELAETPRGEEWQVSAIKANWRPKEFDTEWPRLRLYGGLLAENATQAAAADILRGALVELIDLNWPVVGHTHDELLLEVEEDEVAEATEQLDRAMRAVPPWATGLPLNCEIWNGRRYRK